MVASAATRVSAMASGREPTSIAVFTGSFRSVAA